MIYVAHIRKSDNEIQTVFEHSLGTADKARVLCEKIGAPLCGYLMGLIHDIGQVYGHAFRNRFIILLEY